MIIRLAVPDSTLSLIEKYQSSTGMTRNALLLLCINRGLQDIGDIIKRPVEQQKN